MKVITVILNKAFYKQNIQNNQFLDGSIFVFYDNSTENIFIPTRYNNFINAIEKDSDYWLVFCHEDWQVNENLQTRLTELDKNSIFGPIGCKESSLTGVKKYFGQIVQSDKNGENAVYVGKKISKPVQIETLDCQCLIVHSSLIKKYKLRFDENLSFDLYVEDFCIQAKEKYNINSYAIQLDCQHYSHGNVTERFYTQYTYLQEKHAHARLYYNTVCRPPLIGRKKSRIKTIKQTVFRLCVPKYTLSTAKAIFASCFPRLYKKVKGVFNAQSISINADIQNK